MIHLWKGHTPTWRTPKNRVKGFDLEHSGSDSTEVISFTNTRQPDTSVPQPGRTGTLQTPRDSVSLSNQAAGNSGKSSKSFLQKIMSAALRVLPWRTSAARSSDSVQENVGAAISITTEITEISNSK
jgi:hypothetical protein